MAKGNKKQKAVKKEKGGNARNNKEVLHHTAPKSKKAQRWEKKMEEQKIMNEMEATISHRFVNLSELLSQKAIGKNFIVENVWWTPLLMIVRSQYNFKTLDNPMAKNKYVKGVNKFQGADKVIFKLAYYQR